MYDVVLIKLAIDNFFNFFYNDLSDIYTNPPLPRINGIGNDGFGLEKDNRFIGTYIT